MYFWNLKLLEKVVRKKFLFQCLIFPIISALSIILHRTLLQKSKSSSLQNGKGLYINVKLTEKIQFPKKGSNLYPIRMNSDVVYGSMFYYYFQYRFQNEFHPKILEMFFRLNEKLCLENESLHQVLE